MSIFLFFVKRFTLILLACHLIIPLLAKGRGFCPARIWKSLESHDFHFFRSRVRVIHSLTLCPAVPESSTKSVTITSGCSIKTLRILFNKLNIDLNIIISLNQITIYLPNFVQICSERNLGTYVMIKWSPLQETTQSSIA